jgi:dihydroxyacetone kinase-like protein
MAALLQAAREGAERGAEATRGMTARHGDRLDDDGGRGHLDPGAASAALLFRVMESSLAGDETAPR